MAFTLLLPPSASRPASQSRRNPTSQQLAFTLTANFKSTTLLLIGATLQGVLLLAVPSVIMLLPSIILLLARLADTLAITYKFKPNHYLQDSIYQKHTVIIPDSEGNMSSEPADEKIAILLLCAKANHPLGFFAPNMKEVGFYGSSMFTELDEQALQHGFLGQSQWTTTDERGAIEFMQLSYWRSVEDVQAYAAGLLHSKARKWWEQMIHKDPENMKHIGLSHEVFEAPKSSWEAVSWNFQPSRLTATSYLKKGDKLIGGTVEDQWISPIVEAKGRLRTSKQRVNRFEHVGDGTPSLAGEEEF